MSRVLRYLVVLLLGAVLLGASAAVPENASAALGRGVVEIRLETRGTDPAVIDSVVSDLVELGANWTRIVVDWSLLQPVAPTKSKTVYDTAYVEHLTTVCAQLEAAGVNVIVSPYLVPEWASDPTLWNSPPSPQYKAGKYYNFYAMDTSPETLSAYQAMCTYLAQTLGAVGVKHYECGNEPNLYAYLYPQTRPGKPYFGPATYLKMLQAFKAGIRAADVPGEARAVVIAGANSPRGGNDALSTTPQRFAGYLKDHGAAKYFDAYSHHPYVTGGSKSPEPNKPPYSTRSAVTLYNIGQLLSLFPDKDFYLTEYGYSTGTMPQFGYKVTLAQQASYLRTAYSMAARHRQIKALLWYLDLDTTAVFTGLRERDGDRKLSWYAFAGGHSLSIKAPASSRASRAFTVQGALTSSRVEIPEGQTLQLQARSTTRNAWKTLRSVRTTAEGGYAFEGISQKATRFYRVIWNGVCQSASRKVRTP